MLLGVIYEQDEKGGMKCGKGESGPTSNEKCLWQGSYTGYNRGVALYGFVVEGKVLRFQLVTSLNRG